MSYHKYDSRMSQRYFTPKSYRKYDLRFFLKIGVLMYFGLFGRKSNLLQLQNMEYTSELSTACGEKNTPLNKYH